MALVWALDFGWRDLLARVQTAGGEAAIEIEHLNRVFAFGIFHENVPEGV